eukprot:7391810-Prymnesium_polylepis.2
MRSYVINKPDWTLADFLKLAARYVHQLELFTRENVDLPAVFSEKGYNRSHFTPGTSGPHIFDDWPIFAWCRAEYMRAVERLRPVFVALGAAEDLRNCNRWHRPSLEEWDAIEKQLDQEEREAACPFSSKSAQRRNGEESSSDDGYVDSEEEGAEGGEDEGMVAATEAATGDQAPEEYYPERILKHRAGEGGPAAKVEGREFLIKWFGFGTGTNDVSWEGQRQLIEDGHALLVHHYLQEHLTLKRPEGLDAAVEAELLERGEAGLEPNEAEAGDEGSGEVPEQPDIQPADMASVLEMLTSRIGGEKPNEKVSKPIKPDASAKERRWYEATHIENPETGQMVHKLTAAAMLQQQSVDSKPGA